MKVAVLISGGVDSSVALRLLKDQGHDITAFYLKIWLEDELSYLGSCPWEEDLEYVRQICNDTDVPLEIIPMQREYWDQVVDYTIAEAKAGRTPNPDILCNQKIKFGRFYEVIDAKFEKVATGHYAQISKDTEHRTQNTVVHLLHKAPDPVKDQTYFLSHLSQEQLSRALFPIGQYSKKEVRELAKKYNLPNQNRKDSQGICFLGKIPFREFLKHHLEEKPGDFIDMATGEKVGEHLGYWFYTIGQRHGLNLGGGPWFVVKKDVEKNIIYLAQGYEPDEVYRSEFEVEKLHWIDPEGAIDQSRLQGIDVKIRHGAATHPCSIKLNKKCVQILLKEPVHGVAPGQFAVFYNGDVCLGGGVIK